MFTGFLPVNKGALKEWDGRGSLLVAQPPEERQSVPSRQLEGGSDEGLVRRAMHQRISKVGEDEQVAEFGAAKVTAPDEAPASNGVNRDILNGLTDLVKRAAANNQSIAELFGITPSDLLALFKLDEVMTMKELAQHMNVDPSFVTTIADTLERRGLARREPSLRDRRMKNLVLTPEGIAAREQMMQELALLMPWCYALDEKERHIFLALIRKMLAGPKHVKRPHRHRTARPRRVGQPRHPGG